MNAPYSTLSLVQQVDLGNVRRRPAYSTKTSPFDDQLITLCRELEKWRTERKEAANSNPDDFPQFERKAALHASVFFVLFLIASYAWPIVQIHRSPAALISLSVALSISLVAAPMLFVFQAIGIAKAQFWRAFGKLFSGPRDNYPFTPLISRIEHDGSQRERLRPFRTQILTTTQERLNHEESELRERLNTFIGTPTIFVSFGVLTGCITAWQNYYAHPSSVIGAFLFFGSMGMLLIGFHGFRLRISLTELARCRSLLILEIARRGAGKKRNFYHAPRLKC